MCLCICRESKMEEYLLVLVLHTFYLKECETPKKPNTCVPRLNIKLVS